MRGHRPVVLLQLSTLLVLTFLLLPSCLLPLAAYMESQSEEPTPDDSASDVGGIVVESDSFTLGWDGVGEAEEYQVFYREHGGADWQPLAIVAATSDPTLTVSSTLLSHGVYEFAVQTVTDAGHTSGLHTSLDPDAGPDGAWYIDWRA